MSLLIGCAVRIDSAKDSLPPKSPDIPAKLSEPELIAQTFIVESPALSATETQLAVDIFDEVSGMLYNINRHPLVRQANGRFEATVMLPENTTLRYRYVMTAPIEAAELKADGQPVGYRVVFVQKNNIITDKISGWPNSPYIGETADLNGIVHDSVSNQPLPDVMINIAGYQTFTDMTGRFILRGLPVGVHVLSAVSIDGSHATFQQQANMVANLATPAVVQMAPLPEINVTLILAPLTDAVGAPVRIAGNYAQAGAIFADNMDGSLASRMPYMIRAEDGSYSLELRLHAGNVLRYRYTLGNGYLNAERDSSGSPLLRMVALPSHDVTLTDRVTTWRINDQAPVTIIAHVPETTPPEDSISIQFITNHKHQPIPMWSMGNGKWMILYFGDPNATIATTYRFARNDQVDLSVDPISSANPYSIDYTQNSPQTHQIEQWSAFQSVAEIPAIQPADTSSTLTGAELMPGYQPNFLTRYRQLPGELKKYGFNWLIFTPSWNVVTKNGMPHLGFDNASSVLLSELAEIIAMAKSGGFKVAIYPQIIFPTSPHSWWLESDKSLLWWQQWYAEYERLLMSFSQFAEVNGADQLIIGGSGVEFSLPGAVKTSGSNFGTPKTAEQLWSDLLEKVRTYYQGEILFGIPAASDSLETYSFFNQVDAFYLTIDDQGLQAYTYDQYTVGSFLDGTVASFYDTVDKPLYFGLASASLTSTRLGSNLSGSGLVSPFSSQYGSANVDLASQDYFYQIYTGALTDRDWISGISTRGFFPVLQLSDFSSSIYGKPAMNTFISLTNQKN